MKFIAFCVIVCALALNLSLNCAMPQQDTTTEADDVEPIDPRDAIDNLSNVLHRQYNKLVNRINETWLQCNETYSVGGDKARVDLFSNANTNEVDPHVSKNRKCLADCFMRKMHLMTADGLDDVKYMKHIRKLRLNYTDYTDLVSNDTRAKMYDVVRLHEVPILVSRDSCFATRINRKTTKMEDYAVLCNDLILSYEQSAIECKDLIDPLLGDKCESAWMIQSCMITKHRENGFESPFYPIYPDPMKKESTLRL